MAGRGLPDEVGEARAAVLLTLSGRFPGALHLVPEPDTELRRLTEAIAGRWPEAPAYGGGFTEVVPRPTLADDQDEAVLAEIETDPLGRVPFTSRASSVEPIVHDGRMWRERASFALRN